MNASRIFIERPVMTTLLCLAILVFGIVAYRALPISALPAVDYPTIQVQATLPGAHPETMAASVATPLERQFSAIAGIETMTSNNTQGSTQITLQFNLSRDIDAAAQDVQSAISAAAATLPAGMPRPPSFEKVNPAEQPIMYLALSSDTVPMFTVSEYADTILAQRISMISGVSRVTIYGEQKYAVRVQVDPDQLAARQIGIDEVEAAVRRSNTNTPTGRLDGAKQAFVIRSSGSLQKANEYRPVIVAWRNGSPIRLAELGRVVDGVENDKIVAWANGRRAVIIAIQRQPGANTVAVADGIHALLPAFRREIPASMTLQIAYDAAGSVRESIHDVEFTLMLTIGLVVMVIFLFLRNLSATLIPALAVPFSIIGTFAVMYLLGYSLNNLSLMALTLSVGFVVDDAIVMLENIVRHMEMGKTRMQAALVASREIGFTILSMTLSLIAVFIPVLFLGGIVGRLLHEFAVTIVVAILISGFVSLTLTPMMGSRFLRSDHDTQHGFMYRTLERGFDAMTRWYEATLRVALRFHVATFATAILMLIGTAYLFKTMPTGFIPSEDSGFVFGVSLGPEDTSFENMVRHHQMVGNAVRAHPAVDFTGSFLMGTNMGFTFANLKPRDQRTRSADEVIEDLRPKVMETPGMLTFLQNPPPISVGTDFTSAYQLTLQSTNPAELYQWAPKLLERMRTLPGFVDLNTSMRISSPELRLEIDRDRAESLGVSPEAIHSALFSSYAGRQVSVIYTPSNQYPVLLELIPEQQRTPEAVAKLRVRSSSGALVPLETLVRTQREIGPSVVEHYGQLPAVSVTFNLARGYSLGEATAQVDSAIRELRMPPTIGTRFQGTVKEFERSFENLSILLVVAVLMIYIVLGVLYESFLHPITILSGLPAAVFGALATLWIFNKQIDLYAFVGLIMLFGVVKKNAIMMIDFAIDARKEGSDAYDAIWRGCLLRFRPIMMTTVAALFGTLPIALGYGQGGDARQPLGLAVVGGLLVSQFLTLYITPVIYLYLDRLQVKFRRQPVMPATRSLAGAP